jgi:hypothetical protein
LLFVDQILESWVNHGGILLMISIRSLSLT